MKKYVLLICMFFITGFILLFNRNEEKIIYTNSKSEQIIDSNALTMMYETDYNVAISTGYDYLEFAFNKVWKERSKIIKKKLLELDKKIQEHKIKIPTIWLDAHHKIYKMVNEIIRKACDKVEDDYE